MLGILRGEVEEMLAGTGVEIGAGALQPVLVLDGRQATIGIQVEQDGEVWQQVAGGPAGDLLDPLRFQHPAGALVLEQERDRLPHGPEAVHRMLRSGHHGAVRVQDVLDPKAGIADGVELAGMDEEQNGQGRRRARDAAENLLKLTGGSGEPEVCVFE